MIGIIYDVEHLLVKILVETAKEKGCDVRLIHWSELGFSSEQRSTLDDCKIVYLDRLGEESKSYGVQFELLSQHMCAPILVNTPSAYWRARNKALAAVVLSNAGVPIPRTKIIYDVSQLNSWPECEVIVAKRTLGYYSDDVVVIDTSMPPIDLLKSWIDRDGHFIIQPFIKNPEDYIWRVDFIGGKPFRASMRYPHKFGLDSSDYPICNGENGGRKLVIDPSSIEEKILVAASSAVSSLGLEIAGVDVLIGPHGEPYICEANPDLESDEDFVDPRTVEFTHGIIDYLLSRVDR